MAIALNDNIKVNAPKPSEERYLNGIVSYSSTTEADTATVGRRYIGLTVNINGEEWWYKTTIADGGLIIKTLGTANGIVGTGTTNTLPKFSSISGLSNSNFTDNGSMGQYSSGTFVVQFNPGGNSILRMSRNQAFILFDNGNPDIAQPFELTSSNYFGANIRSGGFMALKVGSAYTNSLVLSGNGQIQVAQTPTTGGTSDFILTRDPVTGTINQIVQSGVTDGNAVHKTGNETITGVKTFGGGSGTYRSELGNSTTYFRALNSSNNTAFQVIEIGPSQGAFRAGTPNAYLEGRESGPQYLAVNIPVQSPNPTASNHLTTKFYVDSLIGSSISGVTLTGTTNFIPKFSSSSALTNSILSDTGNTLVLQSNLSFTSTTNIFDAYSNNILRTSLRPTGIQLWYLNSGVAEVGAISYSTPGGNPGIVFFNPTVTSRTDIRLNSQTGGLAFGTNSTGAIPSTQLLLTTNGNFLINTTTDNGVDKLQVNGSILSTSFKKQGGTSTQFLMADGSVSTGTSSASISYWTAGTGTNAIAVSGNNNTASGNYSLAEGLTTVAGGVASHSEGGSTIATGDYSHAEGGLTKTYGNYSHSEGVNTIASGFTSHAEGQNTQANGNSSHAEGFQSIATGDWSHSEGNQTQSVGTSSHSEGIQTYAFGTNSHAEGNGTQSIGNNSHSEGFNAVANGDVSHVEGFGTQTNNSYAHAEGILSQANGLASHAEGNNTRANGSSSHAGGINSQALGITSFVHGDNSVANNTNVNIFGANITGSTANTTYVDNFNIKTVGTGTTIKNLGIDVNGNVIQSSSSFIFGTGTTNVIPKWSSTSGLTNSNLTDNGTVISASTGMIINDTILAGSTPLSGSVLNIQQTWNTSGSPTAIKVNIINTTAGTNANIFDFQITGSSQLQLNKFGTLSVGLGTGATPISNAKLDVYSTISGSTPFNVEGTQGQLFSVTDTMTGWIHGVNDISGVPLFRVNSNEYSEIKGELYFQDSNVTGGFLSGVTANTIVKTISLIENGGNMFFYDYFARNITTNGMRGGTIMALTDNTGITSTDTYVGDLNASTSGLTLSTIISGTNIILSAIVTTGSWIIKANTRII